MNKFHVDENFLDLPTPNFTADIDIGDVLQDSGRSSSDHEYAVYQRLNNLLQEYQRRQESSGMGKWFVPGTPFGIEHCHKHRAFFDAGREYGQRLFMAANRVGKTVSGALESSYHATGEYPEWWTGRRFDSPTRGWAMGSTARSTRDTVQKELLGPIGAWGTGMLPAEKIGEKWALSGVPQGIDMIRVKHISGGWSTIGFKNYEQPIEAFYGTDLHWVWPDEIVPINIYNECLVRTMTTGGIIYVTFTPLKGLTPLVVKFCETADYLAGAKRILGIPEPEKDADEVELIDSKSYKAIVQAGWDDAPWLDEDEKNKILDASEPHLRETRRSGVPSMGSGNVYPLTLDSMMVDPFVIPNHFKRLYAFDVGWNRTAALWGALDPNTDTLYLYDEHYIAEQPPAVHAHAVRSRGEWIPGVIDPASKGRAQGDGTQLLDTYMKQGLKLALADNAVEPGIQEVWQRMAGGKLKFFTTLHNTAKEYVLYRRDDKGRIVKEKDHLMDCLRYLVVSIKRARSIDEIVRAPVYKGPTRYNI
jgi:phage terminase large subunit-like protein